jgi:hypothetical protein
MAITISATKRCPAIKVSGHDSSEMCRRYVCLNPPLMFFLYALAGGPTPPLSSPIKLSVSLTFLSEYNQHTTDKSGDARAECYGEPVASRQLATDRDAREIKLWMPIEVWLAGGSGTNGWKPSATNTAQCSTGAV